MSNRLVRSGRAGRLLWGTVCATLWFLQAGWGQESPQTGWVFRRDQFVIGAWSPPLATEAEYILYKEAGFNAVLSPRYAHPAEALQLAERFHLSAFVDTYAPNERPWGNEADAMLPHPTHHPASQMELQWLHRAVGRQSALAGYLLGEDVANVPQELATTTLWMKQRTASLVPLICQNSFVPESLSKAGNPVACVKILPTLTHRDLPAWQQAELFCEGLEALRSGSLRYGLVPWPLFNISAPDPSSKMESDSLLRFQIYASVAYGAQGIFYHTYRGSGGLFMAADSEPALTSLDEARKRLDPKWPVARTANHMIAAWGRLLLGRTAGEVYHTGSWPVDRVVQSRTRVDDQVHFDWGDASPMAMVPQDRFQVTWTGFVSAPKTTRITFHTFSDDGVRLWVDGQSLIDDWIDHSPQEDQGTLPMDAKRRVPIKLAYYEAEGQAQIKLMWSSLDMPKEVIPASHLFVDEAGSSNGLTGEYLCESKGLWAFSESPGPGKLVDTLSDDLLVGILSTPDEADLAMIVDKRVDPAFGALAPRDVTIRFSNDVRSLVVLGATLGRTKRGHEVTFPLEAGAGQLIEIRKKGT